MRVLACVNGEILPVEQARVPIWDRGFLFGDAVYEVMRLYRGRCWLRDEHMARLRRSLKEIEILGVNLERLDERIRRTIAESGVGEGIVYIQITRGVAPRTHPFPMPPVEPTEVIIAQPFDDSAFAALRVSGVATISRPDQRWGRCDIKSTNLLANVLSCEAAHRVGAIEAILTKPDGRVTEATHSSVLWVRGGSLQGTPEGPGILPGMTRRLMLRLATHEGLPYQDSEVSLRELMLAEEVILAGTTVEVMPIVKIDNQPIAGGHPGPWSQRLQAAYRREVNRWLSQEPI